MKIGDIMKMKGSEGGLYNGNEQFKKKAELFNQERISNYKTALLKLGGKNLSLDGDLLSKPHIDTTNRSDMSSF